MNKENSIYIDQIKVEDIPWHRLTTPYGRATEFPSLFDKISHNDVDAIRKLANEIEHQDTLYHSTPFALIFICRILKENSIDSNTKEKLLSLLIMISEAIQTCLGYDGDKYHLEFISDMLLEEHLWSEVYDEDDDIARYMEGGGPSDQLFGSFYFFSIETLNHFSDVFVILEGDSNPAVRDSSIELNEHIKCLLWE